ncbi:MAG: YkgJ family cysteine cluster protein [Candidatus Lokiarchaeota archaeon]|nr:YkgJ family cysteine cluster protein [Candidatus Lokiarchaeota archaeon]
MDAHLPDLPLDPAVFSNDAEADCCDCDGECCHEHSILLTHRDVNRILARMPRLDPRELLVFFEAHDGYVDIEALGGYPAIELEGGPCFMGLRFVVDELDARRHCRFLDHETNRCTIHEFKPMVCNAYPFIVDGGSITRHRTIRCKRPYHPRTPDEIAGLRATLQEAYREFGEYKDEVARWNDTKGEASFEAFVNHFFKF